MLNGRKRQRLEEEQPGVDVRLNEELRGLLSGQKYVKTKDLTREILLEYAKRQGAVTEVDSKKSSEGFEGGGAERAIE